jgi:hypothetical protein
MPNNADTLVSLAEEVFPDIIEAEATFLWLTRLASGPTGKLFTARAFIGVIGGLRNLSSELLEIPTRNGILLSFGVTNTRATEFLIKSPALRRVWCA